MNQRARVVGVGMIPLTTPSRSEPDDVMGAYVGYVYGDSARTARSQAMTTDTPWSGA